MQDHEMNNQNGIKQINGEVLDRITDLKEGEIVTFGSYMQDEDPSKEPKPIEWIVLSVEENRVLLFSRYVLDVVPYHKDKRYRPWKSCTIRKWLNKDFYKKAFTDSERRLIRETNLKNEDFIYFFNPANTDTTDRIFPLSKEELNFCIHVKGERYAEATPFALKKGVTTHLVDEELYDKLNMSEDGVDRDVIGLTVTEWWVRSNADGWKTVDHAWIFGARGGAKTIYDGKTGVRPALYVGR